MLHNGRFQNLFRESIKCLNFEKKLVHLISNPKQKPEFEPPTYFVSGDICKNSRKMGQYSGFRGYFDEK